MDRRAFLSSAAAAALVGYISGGQAAKAAPLGKVRELGVLRVAVYKDNRPWSWRKDGKLTGIDVDLAQALAAQVRSLRTETHGVPAASRQIVA